MVIGRVGSGKSTFLSGLNYFVPRVEGEMKVSGSVAYVAQQAWILNSTVRENILFGKPYDEEKYQKTIAACQLEQDLDVLPNKDFTYIGERGVTLSGGQKQRVAIARAVYASADVYLMDDPLSAVDNHVGAALFEKGEIYNLRLVPVRPRSRCERRFLRTFAVVSLRPSPLAFKTRPRRLSTPPLTPFNSDRHLRPGTVIAGSFMKKATRVLVTNALQYLPKADSIVVLDDGEVVDVGTYKELMAKGLDFATLMAAHGVGAFYLTLVPVRPRRRGGRRSLRTFPGVSLRPHLAFNPRPRRLSTLPLTPFNSI